jgi:hypothetical protein
VVFNPSSGTMKIGQSATVTITAGANETGLLASTTQMSVNGRNINSTFAELGGGQYRITYTLL